MENEKQPEEKTELVKELDNPKRNYIFKKNGATAQTFRQYDFSLFVLPKVHNERKIVICI